MNSLVSGSLARQWQNESTKRIETDQFGKTLYSKTEEADRKVVDRLGELSEKRGVPRAQLAPAWMLSKPFLTSPIVGATKPNHLTDAVAAALVGGHRILAKRNQGDRHESDLLATSRELLIFHRDNQIVVATRSDRVLSVWNVRLYRSFA